MSSPLLFTSESVDLSPEDALTQRARREGATPSGLVNFSKVSHARLEIGVNGFMPDLSTPSTTVDETMTYFVDVYLLRTGSRRINGRVVLPRRGSCTSHVRLFVRFLTDPQTQGGQI